MCTEIYAEISALPLFALRYPGKVSGVYQIPLQTNSMHVEFLVQKRQYHKLICIIQVELAHAYYLISLVMHESLPLN